VTRYLLDTNILSNLTKPEPSQSLIDWISEQEDEKLFVASMTIAEVGRGILDKPAGRNRAALEAWLAGSDGLPAQFAGRVLPFDEKAGMIWATLMAEGKAAGRTRGAVDMIIAAVATANGCVIVTDDEKHFWGLKLINPIRLSL
jgi:toxin FitB